MTDDPIALAEAFLQEAVFRSRSSQAMATALKQPASSPLGTCGLGQQAAIDLDLSPRGRELFDLIWRTPPPHAELERIRKVMSDWIASQDALDRKRNHFLKAFRQHHGLDRTQYASPQSSDFESGLARINDEESRSRRTAAEELLRPH